MKIKNVLLSYIPNLLWYFSIVTLFSFFFPGQFVEFHSSLTAVSKNMTTKNEDNRKKQVWNNVESSILRTQRGTFWKNCPKTSWTKNKILQFHFFLFCILHDTLLTPLFVSSLLEVVMCIRSTDHVSRLLKRLGNRVGCCWKEKV